MNKKVIIKVIAMVFMATVCFYFNITQADAFALSNVAMTQAQQKYGNDVLTRVNDWIQLINDHREETELRKLRLVTDFFHQYKFESDETVWGQENYWATPVQLLGRQSGDCEDYVIAKYFTLKEMGIPIKKMRFIYVTSKKLKTPHMILAYYEHPDDDPLILDNTTSWILYGTERPDLNPVYSFNGESMWFIIKSKHKKVSSTEKFSLWQDLTKRMRAEHMPEGMIK